MDAAHDKLYGRIADLLAQEAQKRNGNLVEFPAEVLQVANTFGSRKEGGVSSNIL